MNDTNGAGTINTNKGIRKGRREARLYLWCVVIGQNYLHPRLVIIIIVYINS